ncbi:alkaline phosphatase [Luteitalea sp. TBR-22]|uniref:alkaline phosphatase D family protein n=1 Tax=Luteitalea sp. TBR-22 TaxID=2802971 RepID=UPI001AF3B31C|nr:alkaline phosphatase D family protein [Luteitalea sp. TBR-22]BCS31381.1 alkaline phosphatase [Luteitalea sp. TBR-22]
MATQFRTQAGPWAGALTDTSITIRASVLRSVTTARVIVAESEDLSTNPAAHEAASLWLDPNRDYRHKIATFHCQGLRPSTSYFYQLELDGVLGHALPGRFRTAPAAGSASSFRFACGGCARPGLFGKNRREAYDAIAAFPDVLFFVHLGDFHYRDIDDESVVPRLEAYDDTLRRDGVGDMFRSVPVAYTWDDHDFLGNNSEGGADANQVARRFARDAYDLYVPHYPLAASTEGIHQSFQIGRVLFLLTDSRFSRSPRKGSGTSGKTMLGVNQKAWLKDQLLRGKDMDLIVWASSVPWIGQAEAGEDYWAGYADERAELANHVRAHQIRNLCMISADAHMVAMDDGSNSGYASDSRGGFPVFQAAALESPESEKGGPYSHGTESGQRGPGIAGRRQFGVCDIDYDAAGVPRVTWMAFRATKETGVLQQLLTLEFPARTTFADF